MTFEELNQKVILWGIEKGIFDKSDLVSQLQKTVEEANEALEAADGYTDIYTHVDNINQFYDDTVLEIGDVLVTLILACEFLQVDPWDCLEAAYNKISKRKGKMVDGKFVKEEDL